MKQRLGPAIAATREWWRQISGRTGQLPETVAVEFAGIGSAVYGRQNSEANSRTQMWRAARRALISSRQQIRIAKLRNRKQHLPDLNP